MNYPEPDNPEEQRINEEASEWLSKMDRGLSSSEQDSYLQWLLADPRHKKWMSVQKQAWQDFDLLSQWRPHISDKPNPDLLLEPEKPAVLAYFKWAAAAAASLLVAWGAFQWSDRSDEQAFPRQELVAKAYEHHVLEDGSEIELKANAIIEVAYSDAERHIRLVSGEAFFSVAKDPNRPFVVKAGTASVRAVGTAFNVNFAANQVEVLVTEGKVRLEPSLQSNIEPNTSSEYPAAFQSLNLTAGQLSTMYLQSRSTSTARSLDATEIEKRLVWKPIVLDFDEVPLTEAIDAFNQRNTLKIVLKAPEYADMPIAATFRSNNVEGFTTLIELTTDLTIDRSQPGQLILQSN